MPKEHPVAGTDQVITDGLVVAERDHAAGGVAAEHEGVPHDEERDEAQAEDREAELRKDGFW